jgi:hypothetical protein
MNNPPLTAAQQSDLPVQESPLHSRKSSRGLLRVGCALVFACAVVWFERSPYPFDSSAPADIFSAGRAMTHVRAIAARPHPSGSEENAQVRQYVMKALTDLGFAPQEVSFESGGTSGVNVMARIPGTESSGAFALMAHYDSVERAPGANDDASGVATILETLRAIRPTLPLKNDLIVLFTDSEEKGLRGAKDFVAHHPWFADVKLIMNVEARGRSGPSFMFETHHNNGWIVREYGRVAPRPFATSASVAVYQVMPNDTDFSPFRDAGTAGLNFAHLEGITHYHTLLDRPDEVDLRTLQHHGVNLLALTRHFGAQNIAHPDAPPVVYFSFLQRMLVIYPISWELPLALIGTAAALGTFLLELKRRQFTLWRFCGEMIRFLVGSALLCAYFQFVWSTYARRILTELHRNRTEPSPWSRFLLEHPGAALLFFTVMILAILLLSYWPRHGKTTAHGLALAPMLLYTTFGLVTVFALPGFSYYFVAPLLGSLLVYWLLRLGNSKLLQGLSAGVIATVLAINATAIIEFFASLPLMVVPALATVAVLYGLFMPFWYCGNQVERKLPN